MHNRVGYVYVFLQFLFLRTAHDRAVKKPSSISGKTVMMSILIFSYFCKSSKFLFVGRCFSFKNSYFCGKLPFIYDRNERIDQLREELHRHNYNYYVLDAPEITDQGV